ncbi:orotate phosphoribosyltransferase [Paenibacillus radicis (ex Gao et al. 2016)]|uniref:Orotate phosphoribosyltransferase n=1 Tax=Paenibacillus radicis (ex Gao et al. 2016) TaxID=1737354 RepID=A0A917HH27_9BACL|nr:orotate phosphoribosyltransferase [Paenibacillus radicis (ex Gao et al. 2016)]GGG78937.1 orotate phosphoribosyltransferase [Paenibacillus radicis (ex Gao et al. 2016)]
MEKIELAEEIYKASHLTGTFRLRSGKQSDHYFDKYLFESNPRLLAAIADKLAPLVPPGTEVLAGLEMGGIPVATALSLKTGIPAAFVRKKAKEYGTCKLAEGIEIAGKNVCIIEDVVTTGGQILLSAEDLKQHGANVQAVVSVIEREAAGRANLEQAGLAFYSLLTMDELLAAVK